MEQRFTLVGYIYYTKFPNLKKLEIKNMFLPTPLHLFRDQTNIPQIFLFFQRKKRTVIVQL